MISLSHKLAEAILQDYQTNPIMKNHCACLLPSNKEVKQVVLITKELLLPGYFSTYNRKNKENIRETTILVRRLRKQLSHQIDRSMRYLQDEQQSRRISIEALQLTDAFIESIPILRHLIRTDLEAAFQGDPAAYNQDMIVLSYPGFYATLIYRIAHQLSQLGVPMLPRMISEFAHRETGIDIGPNAQIGSHFFIDHGTGVVIGDTCVIGNHVKLYQGVTLGALSTARGRELRLVKRHPTLEDHVTIYANATILGGDTVIGPNSTIGANVFLMNSVPAASKVSMKHPEVIILSKEVKS